MQRSGVATRSSESSCGHTRVPRCAGGWALALATSGLAGAGGPGQAGVCLTSLRHEQGKLLSATRWGDTCRASSRQPEPPLSLRSWPEKGLRCFLLPKKKEKPKNLLPLQKMSLHPLWLGVLTEHEKPPCSSKSWSLKVG